MVHPMVHHRVPRGISWHPVQKSCPVVYSTVHSMGYTCPTGYSVGSHGVFYGVPHSIVIRWDTLVLWGTSRVAVPHDIPWDITARGKI